MYCSGRTQHEIHTPSLCWFLTKNEFLCLKIWWRWDLLLAATDWILGTWYMLFILAWCNAISPLLCLTFLLTKSESKSNLVMQTICYICWYKDKESRIGKDRPSEEGWRPVMSQFTDLPKTLIFKQGPLCSRMIMLWLSCEIHKI